MNYLKTFLLLLVLLPINLMAQQFFPGYAVSSKGDTSRGYIKYKRWDYNPRTIQFKADPNVKPTNLSVNDTKYFSIDIGYQLGFMRYTGSLSMDDINIDRISWQRDTTFKIDTVFLKVLRKGNVSLFSFADALKTRYFISDSGSQPVELIYRLYKKNEQRGENSITINEDTYKQQLTALAEKYGKMDDRFRVELNNTGYSEATITASIDKINGFNGPDPAKGNDLGTPSKARLVIMLGAFAVVAYLVFSVMHK